MPMVEGFFSLYKEIGIRGLDPLKSSGHIMGFPYAKQALVLFDSITDPSTRRTSIDWDEYPRKQLILIGAGDEREYPAFVELSINPPKGGHLSMEGYSGPITLVKSSLVVYGYRYDDARLGSYYNEVYAEVYFADAIREAARTVSAAQWHPVSDVGLPISPGLLKWYSKVFEQANRVTDAALLNGECQKVKASVLYL